jgi:hypothetical protein
MEESSMPQALTTEATREILALLEHANRRIAAAYPGEAPHRQPVHTVYGGAHLFKADIAAKLGAGARDTLAEYAPDPGTFARALGLGTSAAERGTIGGERAREADLAESVHRRVIEKLEREPVEDFRIDFEDGYGNRSDAEEDGHAERVADELARGMRERSLPPFVDIRIKPFSRSCTAARCARSTWS